QLHAPDAGGRRGAVLPLQLRGARRLRPGPGRQPAVPGPDPVPAQIEVLRRKSDPGTAPLGPGGRGLRPAPGTGDPAGRDPGARRCAGRRLRPDPQGLAAVGDAGDRGAVETDRLAGARLTCPKPSAWPAKRPSTTSRTA